VVFNLNFRSFIHCYNFEFGLRPGPARGRGTHAPGNNLNLNRATMSHRVPCRGLSAWAGGALERSAAGRARRRRRVLERRERAVRGARGPRSPAVSTTAVRRLCGGAPPHRRGPNAPAPGTARPEGTTPPRDTRIHLVCSADSRLHPRWCLTVRVEGSCAPGAVGRHLLHLRPVLWS
jgi:hypothetical protein